MVVVVVTKKSSFISLKREADSQSLQGTCKTTKHHHHVTWNWKFFFVPLHIHGFHFDIMIS